MPVDTLARDADKPAFDGDLIGPGDPDYDRFRRVWNGTIDKRPSLIIRARSTRDVRAAIRLAAERDSALAIRCGGHSFPGLSTCDAGIVLDLANMNQVSVNVAERIAEVGGGALLGDLDKAGNPHGLVTPAGVVSHTGVAGLTLGGGMGWLSRRFGLTIDSLLAAEICLADGSTIEASTKIEPDLYWALRGGGGNFGVVTKFVFRMHQLGAVLVGRWEYPARQMRAVLSHYSALAALAPRQLAAAFTATSARIAVTAFWSGDFTGAEAAIARYGELAPGSSGSLGETSFLDVQSRNDTHFPWGRRYYAKGGFLDELPESVIECVADRIAGAPTPDSEIYMLQLGGAINDVGEAETAYSGRSAAFYWIVEPVWDDISDDARCLTWGREAARRLTEFSASRNYLNEQSETGGNIAEQAYGPAKYKRLVTLGDCGNSECRRP